jgi:hypothetical protein
MLFMVLVKKTKSKFDLIFGIGLVIFKLESKFFFVEVS